MGAPRRAGEIPWGGYRAWRRGFASGFVFLAGQLFPEADGELSHNIAIFFAQLVGFGIVWVARFIFLDKLIFKATHHEGEPLKPANAAAE